jgi:hypothetical protein
MMNFVTSMGRCQFAGTSKNIKVKENFPPASVLVCGLRIEISIKNYYSNLKLVRSKIIFVLSCHNIKDLFKNLLLSSPLFKPTAPKCTPH